MNRPSFYRRIPGFSLLELMVVVAIIGGLILIAVPSLRALGGLDLKKEIMKIAGLTNEVYDRASILGKTHRVVFDLDEHKYWVEEKEGDVVGEINPELGYDELMRERIKKNREQEAQKDRFVPSFKAVEGSLGEKQSLPENVVIFGVWTDQMQEVCRKGQASIYFFSDGYTQSSFVSLSLKGEDVESAFYLSLSPLTGKAEINVGEPETSELSEKSDS